MVLLGRDAGFSAAQFTKGVSCFGRNDSQGDGKKTVRALYVQISMSQKRTWGTRLFANIPGFSPGVLVVGRIVGRVLVCFVQSMRG
jgi:hypothetical protein